MLGRKIGATLARFLQADRIRPRQAVGGPGMIPAGVEHVGQAEQQVGAWNLGQLRVGQSLLEGGQVGVGQLAAQQGRQPGVGHREAWLAVQRFAEGRLGVIHLAEQLVEPAEVQVDHPQVGVAFQHVPVPLVRLGQPALLLERAAERQMRGHPIGIQGHHALPAGNRFRRLVQLVQQFGQPLPERHIVGFSLDRSPQPRHGPGEMTPALEDPTDVGVGGRQLRVQSQGFPVFRPGLVEPIQRHQHLAQVVVQFRRRGIEANRLLRVRQGFRGPVEVHQHQAKVRLGRGERRLEFHGASELDEGLLALPPLAEGQAEVVDRDDERRTQRDGALECLHRLVRTLQRLQRHTQAAQRLGVIRPELECRATAFHRALEFPGGSTRLGETAMVEVGFRPQGHGPLDQLHRPNGIADLMMQQAEPVQGLGVLSPTGQHALVELCGSIPLPRPVELDRGSEHVTHGKRRAASVKAVG